MKFKVWCKEHNEWETHTLVGADGTIWKHGINHITSLREETHDVCWFTKLHDKNGKEIYQNSIVQLTNLLIPTGIKEYRHDCNYIVTYKDGQWKLKLIRNFPKSEYYGNQTLSYYAIFGNNSCRYLTEIGNIYENPELMKGL